jgi:hypothetical protein
MRRQDFDVLIESGLLTQVEQIVVESHRKLYLAEGKEWSRSIAYRWLRYEDPMPVERLAEGVEKLRKRSARFDPEAVEKVCANGAQIGFLI